MSNEILDAVLAVPELSDFKKILCIQPHADDIEIGMGGTVALLCSKGCHVDYLTVTNGDLGNMGLPLSAQELVEVRKKEAEASARLLGVKSLYWLDYPDGSLRDIPKLAGEIAELIRTNHYEAVFCPDPWLDNEAHQDHIVTGRAVVQAAINCSLKTYPRETKTAAWELQAVGLYFTNNANTKPVITKFFERKFEAMALHETQLPPELLELYRMLFEIQGKMISGNEEICEGLKLLTPLQMHCFSGMKLI